MPTYEYRCDACGHEFERVQRFDEERVARCPNCGARPRRLLSRPAIVFKGSGWHVTDYRRAGDGSGPEGGRGGESPRDGAGPKEPAKEKKETPKKESTKESTKKESAQSP